jgi:hypothetical protein
VVLASYHVSNMPPMSATAASKAAWVPVADSRAAESAVLRTGETTSIGMLPVVQSDLHLLERTPSEVTAGVDVGTSEAHGDLLMVEWLFAVWFFLVKAVDADAADRLDMGSRSLDHSQGDRFVEVGQGGVAGLHQGHEGLESVKGCRVHSLRPPWACWMG